MPAGAARTATGITVSIARDPALVRTVRLVAAAVARRASQDEEFVEEVRLAVGEACALLVGQDGRPPPTAVPSRSGCASRTGSGSRSRPPATIAAQDPPTSDIDGVEPWALLRGLIDDFEITQDGDGTTCCRCPGRSAEPRSSPACRRGAAGEMWAIPQAVGPRDAAASVDSGTTPREAGHSLPTSAWTDRAARQTQTSTGRERPQEEDVCPGTSLPRRDRRQGCDRGPVRRQPDPRRRRRSHRARRAGDGGDVPPSGPRRRRGHREHEDHRARRCRRARTAYLTRQFKTLAVFAAIAFFAAASLLPADDDARSGSAARSSSWSARASPRRSATSACPSRCARTSASPRRPDSEGRDPAMRIAFRTGGMVGMADRRPRPARRRARRADLQGRRARPCSRASASAPRCSRCSCASAAASSPRPPTSAPTWSARSSRTSPRTTRATPRRSPTTSATTSVTAPAWRPTSSSRTP